MSPAILASPGCLDAALARGLASATPVAGAPRPMIGHWWSCDHDLHGSSPGMLWSPAKAGSQERPDLSAWYAGVALLRARRAAARSEQEAHERADRRALL